MGTTIIMVTHDPELARRAHRNVQVVDGQISDFKPYEPHAGAGAHAHLKAVESAAGAGA
jgi:putative ABC transport system ATP-binding protein